MEGSRLGWVIAGAVAIVAAIILVLTYSLDESVSSGSSKTADSDSPDVSSDTTNTDSPIATTAPSFILSQHELESAESLARDVINVYGLYPGPEGEQPILDEIAPYITDELQARLSSSWKGAPTIGIVSVVNDIRLEEAPLHQSVDEVQLEAFVTKTVTYPSSTETYYPTIAVTMIKSDGEWIASDIKELGINLLDS